MLIAAALIELNLPASDSIKARRRVANSIKDRLRQRFNLSVADLSDADDRHQALIGCVMIGIRPDHLRDKLEKVVRYVEGLGLAEVASDDILVVRLDEVEELPEDVETPAEWLDDDEAERS